MRLLVLGGSGQVGRALARAGAGESVRILTPTRAAIDICDRARTVRAIEEARPDVIVNAAAYTAVDEAEREADLAFRVNRDGAANVAAAAAGLPLVHLSTDYVFGGDKGAAYGEDDAPGPLSVYGLSKLAGEDAVRGQAPRHIILRTSWVFSPWGGNFVLTMRRLADEGRDVIRVVADQYGAPTAATAIAASVLGIVAEIGRADFGAWGTYHFCGRPATTWFVFAEAILADRPDCRVEPIATSEWPTPARRPMRAELDCARIARTFGVRQPSWHDDLEQTLAELE